MAALSIDSPPDSQVNEQPTSQDSEPQTSALGDNNPEMNAAEDEVVSNVDEAAQNAMNH